MQQENVVNILQTVFQKRPYIVQYKGLVAQYDPAGAKARVSTGTREFPLNNRSFFILKYLVDHLDQCVSREELEKFWLEHGVGYHGKEGYDSGLRTYIRRDIKKKLGLEQYLRRCPKPKGGWKLVR
jgi:DNA-binding response OmpR family regulator